MSGRVTLSAAGRVLGQLRRDPRTIALLLVVPCVRMTICATRSTASPRPSTASGRRCSACCPSSRCSSSRRSRCCASGPRGRSSGLVSMPVGKLDLLAGYGIAFGLLALVQTVRLAAVSLGPLGLDTDRSAVLPVALAILNALLGMSLRLFVSAFATSEFQAVQFMPAVVLPQLLLCGLFVARDEMAGWLEAISYALPLTYAYDALSLATGAGSLGGDFAQDVTVVVLVTVGALALGAVTMRRRTA